MDNNQKEEDTAQLLVIETSSWDYGRGRVRISSIFVGA
jgi:hypothetical protein